MNSFLRFYNKNRQIFWIIIAIVAFIIIISRILGSYYKETKEKSSGIYNNTTTSNIISKPQISGEEQSEEKNDEQLEIIDKFISFLNDGKPENAYKLLSADCKEIVFPEFNDFKTKYYDKMFGLKRLYDADLWVTNNRKATYRITLTEDLLATGGKSTSEFQDFYTIVNEDNNYKLNIMNFINKESINTEIDEDDYTITVKNRIIYEEYEIYEITFKNKTQNTMILDSKENSKTTYMTDQNGSKYYSFLNEKTSEELYIYSGMTSSINIKFNKIYNPKYSINEIHFDDVKINNENIKISIDL